MYESLDHVYSHCSPDWVETIGDKAEWIYGKIELGFEKTQENLRHLEIDGMIPKRDLVDGITYIGFGISARMSHTIARWFAKEDKFVAFVGNQSFMFCHPEDDIGTNIFIPVGVERIRKT